MAYDFTTAANSLDEFWMPFTPQRYFKKAPRMIVRAKGMYYYDPEGKEILDAAAGMWCVNAGHDQPKIKEAITAQLELMDYAPCFQFGYPTVFKAASRLIADMPEPFTNVFFSNSGSEAVDTALKIALAYHRIRGEGTRRVLIGRERGYHGVGFGGISVGGLPYNRATFGQLLPNIDHLRHTHDLMRNAFARGMPDHGAEYADELDRLIYLHDPMNIAAVIVEPVAGSTGVLPPPKGYLQRLREICTKHGILLIFDEVVTGFGRFGTMSSVDHFGVMPDIITMAKGITNGTVPLGATFVTKAIYDAFMQGPEHIIELMHGYTYSGHPLAAAAIIGTLDTIQDQKIWDNAKAMAKPFEDAVHSLKGEPHVVDVRNCGMLAGIQLAESKDPNDLNKYPREVSYELFRRGLMVRYTGPNLYLSPPLIINQAQIDQIVTTIKDVLKTL
ncbi:aspartate aminotransferase family protein [Micavibrio aeruginosavorus]|uniref:Omega-amino acid--pyruvate aminotransferase n=1 Tax=Micavibrio aeruginosavorus EPB TaxID=349215 RepID=M4VFI8_9BACT|nr:aspartate aminotransferase family protein [Micavibrio aeruginosavorus]AGH97255.1 Omega-amino acid--pyruvate aminotransferase [Micavibrio aeruginosavorus EPB]